MRDYIWWTLPMSWLFFIFGLSGQSSEDQEMEPFLSTYLPLEKLEPLLSKIEFTYYHRVRSVEAMGLEPFVEFLFRKLAHFGVYFILAVFVAIAVQKTLQSSIHFQIMITYFLMIHFAILDELNQSFAPDRTPYYGDIMIDAFGGLVGVFVVFSLKRLFSI